MDSTESIHEKKEKSKKESAVKGKNGLLKKDTISNDSEKNASQIIIH